MKNKRLLVVVILGTDRKGNKFSLVAELIESVGNEIDEIDITFIDPVKTSISSDNTDSGVKQSEHSVVTRKVDAFFY